MQAHRTENDAGIPNNVVVVNFHKNGNSQNDDRQSLASTKLTISNARFFPVNETERRSAIRPDDLAFARPFIKFINAHCPLAGYAL